MSQAQSYIIDRPLEEGDLFVGRFSALLDAALQVKRGKPLLLVFGARRSGVTSFLNHLQSELASTGTILRVELTEQSAEPDQLLALVTAAVEGCTALRSEVATDLAAQPAATRQRCVVLADGLPIAALQAAHGTEWAAAVLEWLIARPSLQLIVAVRGRRPSGGDAFSSKVTGLPTVELVNLSLEQVEELLTRGAGSGSRFEFDAMRRVWHLTSGNPFLVQLFGLVLQGSHLGGVRISAHAVERAVPAVLERAASAMETLWADCSLAAQATLAVANELPGRHGTFTQNDVISAARQHAANLRGEVADKALSELEMLGILEKLGRGSYRHSLELFRLWCATNRRLETLLDRGKEYERVLGAGTSLLGSLTWRAALGWGGLLAALVFSVLLWNSRQPATTTAARQTPTVTAPVATRPPVVPGTSQGWITYMAKANPDAVWDVWLMRGDGSDPKRLTNDASNNQTPCWSADGRLIAFVSDRDGNKEIYTLKADGTTPLNLTHHPAEDWTPAWSPDGTTIAFSSYRDGNWEIYLMDANGANPRRITRNNAADYAPSWSPDGELIAFESYRDGNMEIYVMAPDGSEVTNLSQDQYSNEHGPAWGRAGTRLLYYSNRDGGWDIYSMKADGSERENLTLNPALEQRPSWHE